MYTWEKGKVKKVSEKKQLCYKEATILKRNRGKGSGKCREERFERKGKPL